MWPGDPRSSHPNFFSETPQVIEKLSGSFLHRMSSVSVKKTSLKDISLYCDSVSDEICICVAYCFEVSVVDVGIAIIIIIIIIIIVSSVIQTILP